MFGNSDLAGWASVLLAVSTLLGAVNAIMNTLLHRKTKENARALETVHHELGDSNRRVEGTYQQMIEESKTMLAYIQGLNTPGPGGKP